MAPSLVIWGVTLQSVETIIIGGGFFGSRLGLELSQSGRSVLLLEKADRLLTRASEHNQARVHNGYHYPRSVLTALRSRVNFSAFSKEYADCIDTDFTKIYAIAKLNGFINAAQFRTFCGRIHAELASAPPDIKQLFHPAYIEDSFIAREYAIDSAKLRTRLSSDLGSAGVNVQCGADAVQVSADPAGLRVRYRQGSALHEATAKEVYHCCYARMNSLLFASKLPIIPLKHELTEMCLTEVPALLRGLGITVMDGPFFSVMPYPAEGLHSLSHVRYTPHCAWFDGPDLPYLDPYQVLAATEKRTHFPEMVRDSSRYLPALSTAQQRGSMWEVKTLLPTSEQNDSRPILFRRDHGLKGFTCILGGKLDNIYDLLTELRSRAAA